MLLPGMLILLLAGCSAPADDHSRPSASPSTSTPAPSLLPASPRLLYEWYLGAVGPSDKGIFLADAAGRAAHLVADDAARGKSHTHGSWSPDGKRIAFTASKDDVGSVWIADADGEGAVEAVACKSKSCLQIDYPIWSPDGKSLLVVQQDKTGDTYGPSRLINVDLATSSRRTIAATADGATNFSYPSWSPDGSRITAALEIYADAASDDPSGSSIVVVDANRSPARPVKITDPGLFGVNPDWSPDGKTIVFSTYQLGADLFVDKPSNLYLIAPDGHGLRQLTTTALSDHKRLGQPTWTPDGRRIIATIGVLNGDYRMQTVKLAYVDPKSGAITDLHTSGSNAQLQPLP